MRNAIFVTIGKKSRYFGVGFVPKYSSRNQWTCRLTMPKDQRVIGQSIRIANTFPTEEQAARWADEMRARFKLKKKNEHLLPSSYCGVTFDKSKPATPWLASCVKAIENTSTSRPRKKPRCR